MRLFPPSIARVILALFVLTTGLLSVVSEEPRPLIAANANESIFSGARAIDTAHRLLPNELPHPTGSDENAAVRERILSEFSKLGYEPEIQVGEACSPYGSCATVHNVIAKLEGKRKEAVLVAAHYDSVPAGPGVGDDLAGAANVLEIARAMSKDPPGESSVIFLIDDGEELGLLGAHAFADKHPLALDVRYAVNMDNRGDQGPAVMFETSENNADVAAAMGRALSHPVTSSLFFEVYKRMPNDTDFTVWKAARAHGANFAFIGGATNYHTPNDDFSHLDPRSLQHEGESGLAMARAFRELDPNPNATGSARGNATYFDLFGAVLVRWPAAASGVLAFVAFMLGVIAVVIRVRRGSVVALGVMVATVAFVLALALADAFSVLIARSLHLGFSLSPWPRMPAPALSALAFAGVAAVALVLALIQSRARAALVHAPWIGFLMIGVAVSALLPGGSYLFVVPGLVCAIASLVSAGLRAERSFLGEALAALPQIAVVVLWAPIFWGIYRGLGLAVPAIFTVIAALVAWPMLARVRSRTRLVFTGAACVLLAAISSLVFALRPSDLAKTSVWFVEDSDAAHATIFANPLASPPSPVFVRAAALVPTPSPPPWSMTWQGREAPAHALPAPTFEVTDNVIENGDRTLSGILRSPRGAKELRLLFAPDREVTHVRIADVDVPPLLQRALTRSNGFHVYRIDALPPEGVSISVTVHGDAPLRATLADVTFDLPEDERVNARERDKTGVAIQDGDITIVLAKVPRD